MKIIGIIGSRRRNTNRDYLAVRKEFDKHYEDGDWLCSGGCPKGGDAFAEEISKNRGIPIIIFPAKWQNKGIYNPQAGLQRNSLIAQTSNILIACVAEDRTGGTEDTINKFVKIQKSDENVFLVK